MTATDPDYLFVKETGEARNLTVVPPKELQALVKSLWKDYEYHRGLYAEGFQPPAQRLDETFREMERCYKNVLAYMRYLRLQKEDVPQILQAAAEKYEEWLDLAGDAIHASRLPPDSAAVLVSLNEQEPLPGASAGGMRVTRAPPSAASGGHSRSSDPPPTLRQKRSTRRACCR
jgi:hypothetical protein